MVHLLDHFQKMHFADFVYIPTIFYNGATPLNFGFFIEAYLFVDPFFDEAYALLEPSHLFVDLLFVEAQALKHSYF